jgi:hypothetical protein
MKKYPYRKVIIFFTLAPMIGGVIFIIFGGIFSILTTNNFKNITDFFYRILFIPPALFVGALFGQVFFFIPAFIFSLIYSGLKLKRVVSSFLKISLVVSLGLVPFIASSDGLLSVAVPKFFTLDDLIKMDYAHLGIIALAVVSSLIMAWFALPKPEDLEGE